jgi:hypothetical protein
MSLIIKASSAPTMLGRKPLLRIRWLVAASVLLAVFYLHPTSLSASSLLAAQSRIRLPAIFEHEAEVEVGDDLNYLKKVLGRERVGPHISYASRTIRYIPDAPDRLSISRVDENLLAQPFQDLNTGKATSLPESSEIEVHVKQSSRPEQVDASSLIFGCSTTYGRFSDQRTSPIHEWERWLTDGNGNSNGAGLVLSLFEASKTEIDRAAETLASLGIAATVVASNPFLDMPGRYVSLVELMYKHPSRDSRKYFILLDDDTFFPAMSDLVETLSHYDHEKSYYIGTFTERARWLLDHQVAYAFGGGGIILTKPLVKEISQLPCLETKDGKYVLDSDEGDRLLYNCIHKYTDTEVTYLPVLHQEDQYGDGSGFYESGTKPLSLHHYKSWHAFIPGKAHVVVDACGEDCLLQRFQFKDDFIVSNGYSVAQYPQGIDFDTGLMEGTFDMGSPEEMALNVAYTFGGLRKSLSETGKKKSWILVDSRREGPGRVRQIYVKRKDDKRWLAQGEQPPATDSVFVLTWVP